MFRTLFKYECKQILKSLVYYIYVIIFILFMTGQMGDDEWRESLTKPEEGLKYYGTTYSDDENIIMERTIALLVLDTYRNSYTTYPLGFYKGVILNDLELKGIEEDITRLTGKDWDRILEEMDTHFSLFDQSDIADAIEADSSYFVPVKAGVTYEEFSNVMQNVCHTIGNGSMYDESKYISNAEVLMTYEDAVKEYENMCQLDRVTGAYMRIFSDYAGIVLALLPIFLGVSRCLRDKRAKLAEVIYSKAASTSGIILSRYLANVVMAFIPVVVTALLVQLPYAYRAETFGITPDNFAFLEYTVVWLLPEIMIVLAVAFLITEITENILSILLQVVWAIASLFSATTLTGNFGLQLVTRWNTIGETMQYMEQRKDLFLNKGFYVTAAAICIWLTIVVYEKKRKEGVKVYGKIFKTRS